MAIKFFNIKTGETRVAETEPHITAMWASSDRSPNITQGQDFGWRLAPEVIVEVKRIASDQHQLMIIASRIGKPLEDVTEPDILSYVSTRVSAKDAPVATDEDYSDVYDNEIRRLKDEGEKVSTDEPAGPVVQQESLAELEKRVELEERLAAARAVPEVPATTKTTTKVK